MKAIETFYNGYRFRSRLEARWAVFFDSLRIPYLYEPEGFLIHRVRYLPDFYLPDSKQFFEVKGQMSDRDIEKINAVIEDGHSLAIGFDDGKFMACNCWGENQYELCTGSDSLLCQCKNCGKYWFMGNDGVYHCEHCGFYSGNDHFDIKMMCSSFGQLYDDVNLWDTARQARFEFDDRR